MHSDYFVFDNYWLDDKSDYIFCRHIKNIIYVGFLHAVLQKLNV